LIANETIIPKQFPGKKLIAESWLL